MVKQNNLYIIDGDFRKGEIVTVSMDGIEAKRKVYYSSKAGENYIHFGGYKYFQHKFKTKSPIEKILEILEEEINFSKENHNKEEVIYREGIWFAIKKIKEVMNL